MAFQKEAPIYLQVRRSNLENIGVLITNPFDYMQVVPYVTAFINSVGDQYFKSSIVKSTEYYDYPNPSTECDGQIVRIYYDIDELSVGGASPYAPVLYSSTLGLLAGAQEFIGLEQNLGCYSPGDAPISPNSFKMVFRPYSEKDPVTGDYIVFDLMTPEPHPVVATVSKAPGYDAISFIPDNHIDPITNPISTAPGYYTFRIYPEVEIQIKP
ncbi:MAG: hypothetical protein ACRDA3_00485 [Peptostreptococcaceae bacterium]